MDNLQLFQHDHLGHIGHHHPHDPDHHAAQVGGGGGDEGGCEKGGQQRQQRVGREFKLRLAGSNLPGKARKENPRQEQERGWRQSW